MPSTVPVVLGVGRESACHLKRVLPGLEPFFAIEVKGVSLASTRAMRSASSSLLPEEKEGSVSEAMIFYGLGVTRTLMR